jgi:hypothetical protein
VRAEVRDIEIADVYVFLVAQLARPCRSAASVDKSFLEEYLKVKEDRRENIVLLP